MIKAVKNTEEKKFNFNGKEFRVLLKGRNKCFRAVPPFSYQSLQCNTKVFPPPRGNPFEIRPVKQTLFRKHLLRGDIPAYPKISQNRNDKSNDSNQQLERKLKWSISVRDLDYSFYLPLFFEGLAELQNPYRTVAIYGIYDMISAAPEKILPIVPKLILPIKKALNTKIPQVITTALKVIQYMVIFCPCVGQALVPYYRQILPICNLFRNVNVNLGDGIDRKRSNRVGDVIEDTLQLLERCGGPDAYINIKYMVPTFESCVMN